MSMTATSPQQSASVAVQPKNLLIDLRWVWLGMLLLGPLPMLVKLGESLWEREQYQFFPFMIVGSILLAGNRWQDRPRQIQLLPGGRRLESALLGLAMCALIFAAMFWVRSAAGICAILILTSVAWNFGGVRMLRVVGPSLILLLTIIPPPGRQEQVITLRLQYFAVRASSHWLEALNVPHIQSGNVLQIPGKRLRIEQACSGINSLMAVLAFSLLYGFWKQRPWWRIVLLLPTAAAAVVFGNIVRITGEAWLKVRWKIDVLEGLKHQMMGLLLFVGCVALVVAFDELLGAVARLVSGRPRFMAAPPKNAVSINKLGSSVRQVSVMSRLGVDRWIIASIFALCGMWIESRVWNAWAPPHIRAVARFDMPDMLEGWERVTHETTRIERPQTEAATSFIWQYRKDGLIANVAIDYPFTGYHALTTCYAMDGWSLDSQATLDASDGALTQVNMTKAQGPKAQLGQKGYLLFGQCDEKGESVVVPRALTESGLALNFEVARRMALGGPTYQTQVLTQWNEELSTDQQASIKELFLRSRQVLTGQLLKQMDAK